MSKFLDNDFYKFTMGQLVFERFKDVTVRYALTLRTPNVSLGEFIEEADLRRELDAFAKVKPTNTDLHYLRGTSEYGDRMFDETYLQSLKSIETPVYDLTYERNRIKLEYEGQWSSAIYSEIPYLAIINELYSRAQMERLSRFERSVVYADGRKRLHEKIKRLRGYPDITFSDFGTRRRFSFEWQDIVDQILAEELPKQFLGTSDVDLAMKHGLEPKGTSAHEMSQVAAGIYNRSDDEIRDSQNKLLEMWWRRYDYGLSIFLPDTFGSEFSLRTIPREYAVSWKGFRQDSGDPFAFGEKVLKFYKNFQINPKEKLIIFSDALDLDTIIALHLYFKSRIRVSFGWGTNLTNDLGWFKSLSMVIKAIMANGQKLGKLSDNLAKAVGEPEEIERLKKIFGYSVTMNQPCVY